jgi:hypothetical protein
MSDYKHKIDSGSVFPNDYKKEEKHPDLKGRCNIGGIEKELAMWANQKDGKTWYSVKFSKPLNKNQNAGMKAEDNVMSQESAGDDGLPF